jgi:hypothetical protein
LAQALRLLLLRGGLPSRATVTARGTPTVKRLVRANCRGKSSIATPALCRGPTAARRINRCQDAGRAAQVTVQPLRRQPHCAEMLATT